LDIHCHVADVEARLLQYFHIRILGHVSEIGRVWIAHHLAFIGLELGIARRCIGRDGIDQVIHLGLSSPAIKGLEADDRVLLVVDELE